MDEKNAACQEALGPVWTRCLDLALEGIAAGSLGIASVITTPAGEIVSSGRNQTYDDAASGNLVRNNSISHAELNAIATMPGRFADRRDLILHATVEPCPMCLGAIVMSRIRRVRIGSADGWAGAVRLLDKDWYLAKKSIEAAFETGIVEKLFFLLHILSIWKRSDEGNRKGHPFYGKMRDGYPLYFPYIEVLDRDAGFSEDLRTKNREGVFARIRDLKA